MNGYLPQTVCTPEQYHCNFQMLDRFTIRLLTSPEAKKVTRQMLNIYVLLKDAPWEFWEKPNALRVIGTEQQTAWEILCELADVASATLNKALQWMNDKGVIKYWSWKNGIGLRIYFNLAINSVKRREPQKNLRLVPTSTQSAPASENEAALYEDFVFRDSQDSEIRADARASEPPPATEPELSALPLFANLAEPSSPTTAPEPAAPVAPRPAASSRLHLVPRIPIPAPEADELRELVVQAVRATEDTQRAIERLAERVPDQNWRDWVERSALPKAVRVWFAEWYKREKASGRGQPKNIDVGSTQPTITPEELAEMLLLFPPTENNQTKEPSS